MLDELLNKLNSEAEVLLHELNVILPAHIETAVALGDLKENSEYHAALERQQFVRARLDHLSRRLAEISKMDMDAIPENRVGFGSQVELLDLDDDTVEKYTIAFGDFIDFEKSEISMASPIGKALLGKSEGDEVNVALPAGTIRYRITAFITLHQVADKSNG